MSGLSRRDFLEISIRGLLAVSSLIGLGGLARFLSYKPDPPPPARYDLGAAGDYPPDSRTVLAEIPALLIRSKNGYSAYSLVCTHLGCTVQVKTDTFACPCHGSRYDDHGKVTRRPASNPLQVLRVETTPEGNLVLYKDRA
jgi:cytochrome b6-f complex iron-sulfur subunit